MKLSEVNFNFAQKINKGALLTVQDSCGRINTMTVSWGGCGILWGKEVCFIYVRPTRFTYKMCEDVCDFSLSFFKEGERKDTLSFCGTKSGRDHDKIKECNLSYKTDDGYVIFDDAEITIKVRKIYSDFIKEECFIDKNLLSNYKNNDFHKVYVCEIIDIQ
jgi:flavin reductase (DIM6/NTAB) family NADH-FMN oxidoreductase RutF